MAIMTKGKRYAHVIADLTILHDAAPKGSSEQQQWKIAIQAVTAARSFGEGNWAQGISQAREAAAAVAGH